MNINDSNYYVEVLDVIDDNGNVKNYFKKNKFFKMSNFKEICEDLVEIRDEYFWVEDKKDKGYRVVFLTTDDIRTCEIYFKVIILYDNEILMFFNE